MRINSAKFLVVCALCFMLSATLSYAAPSTSLKKLSSTSKIQQTAETFLIDYIAERYVSTGREGLALAGTAPAENGTVEVRFTQTIDGIPVDGSGLSVYLNARTGKAEAVKGDFLTAGVATAKNLRNGKTSIIDALAVKGIANPALMGKPTLVYVKSFDSNTVIPAWRARTFFTGGAKKQVKDVYVNANTGEFVAINTIGADVGKVGASHIQLPASRTMPAGNQGRNMSSDSDAWFGPAPMAAILPNCGNDADADCLNDDFEDWIGARVAPVMFYDEDESCVAGIQADFRGVTDEKHYDRKDFFQVRPYYYNVADWNATDGKVKKIGVTYIFAYTHDCQTPAFGLFGGHQGDIEKVHFTLQSRDLKSWDIVEAEYRYHSDGKTVAGDIIRTFAEELGLDRPIIAVSEASHASYFGKWTDIRSSTCDPHGAHKGKGPLGIVAWVVDDCFCKMPDGSNGSPQECLNETTQEQGRWINLSDSLLANIGEPEQFRLGDLLQVDGRGHVFTEMDVGHGTVREYWSKRVPKSSDRGFCGWECPNDQRVNANTCSFKIHGEKHCVGPLYGKVDKGLFSLGPLVTNDPEPNPCQKKKPQRPGECDDIANPQ